jgi:acyl-coenzyme A thioesterase PaaI-like protein
VSEAAPGIPDSPAYATAERAQLALALRHAIDAAMSTEDIEAETLLEVAREIEGLAVLMDGNRSETPGGRPRSHDEYLPRSPIVGEASPFAPGIEWEFADGVVEGRGTFGVAYEGPPGYVHGGWIACAFDEMLGIANIESGLPGMTGRLTVHYRRPTPLFRELRLRAWIDRVAGRRILTRGELYDGETLTAEAEGVFIQLRPEQALAYFDRETAVRRGNGGTGPDADRTEG